MISEEQFENKLRKLLSQQYTLNQNELKVQVKSVPKEQFYKHNSYSKRKKYNYQDNKFYIESKYKQLIKKYNYNIFVISKLIQQNSQIYKQLSIYPKIQQKFGFIATIQKIISNFKKIIIYFQDIDKEIFNRIMNGEK